MKIYAVSKGHPERMHAFRWMDEYSFSYSVVVDDKNAAKRVTDACNAQHVYVTKQHGVLAARAYISSKLVKRGEWYVGFDDNVRTLHKVRGKLYDIEKLDHTNCAPEAYDKKLKNLTWRQAYREDATELMLEFLDELRAECERKNTVYGGFASQENPYFRQGKWGYYRFVKTKLFVMRNDKEIVWGGSDHAHDSFMSAFVVARYGCIVVNNYMHPAYKMYEEGGLGKREERTDLEPALDEICRAFPGLVTKGRGANTALRFVRHGAGVERWRIENGWTK